MRIFTRLGVVLMTMAALVTTTTGVASAATGYAVNVFHSSGALATSGNGNLTWSTSRRTVSVTTPSLYVRAGEWADVTWSGRQGNTQVTDTYWVGQDQRGKGAATVPITPFSMSTATPGGITFVRITVRDIDHQIVRTADCYYYMSSCP
jgi:hypothetical protein